MTFSILLTYITLGFVIVALILFPDFRKKLLILCGGFLNLFIEDKAKTPDGARAIYQQAIERAQGQFNEAHDMLQKNIWKIGMFKKRFSKSSGGIKGY